MICEIEKKPIVVSAVKFNGRNYSQCFKFMTDANFSRNIKDAVIRIHTLEGTMIASAGDWIIRGINGEYYPCKPDIFKNSYNLIKVISNTAEPCDICGSTQPGCCL